MRLACASAAAMIAVSRSMTGVMGRGGWLPSVACESATDRRALRADLWQFTVCAGLPYVRPAAAQLC
jgi:hypothetical protein